MIRALIAAAAFAAAVVGSASAAAADPPSSDSPGRYSTDVPGMSYEASLGAPCTSWQVNVFGRGPGGEALQCRWIPNQWPPIYTGFWVASYPLYGVQDIGAPCPGSQAAAQSPDGRPMLCLGARGWQPGVYTGNGFFPV
ncbi:MAG: hypothetical protein JST91_18210 [Actinobacteria bacterium]|nr:hypothetical protein [Actinomycetota bacterium]